MKEAPTIESLFTINWITYETGVKGEFNIDNKWEFVPSVSFKA